MPSSNVIRFRGFCINMGTGEYVFTNKNPPDSMSCIIKPWEPLCNQFLNFYFVALTSSNKKTDDIFRNFRKSFQSKCALNFWIWDCYHCLICPWSYHTVPTSRCICAAYEPLKIVLLASGSSLGSYLSGLYPLLVFIYKIQ